MAIASGCGILLPPAKVIAARLGLAEDTVRNHIRAILMALGSHSQLEAVAKARVLQYLN